MAAIPGAKPYSGIYSLGTGFALFFCIQNGQASTGSQSDANADSLAHAQNYVAGTGWSPNAKWAKAKAKRLPYSRPQYAPGRHKRAAGIVNKTNRKVVQALTTLNEFERV